MENILYNRYSTYLKEKYGEKVYKIPISLPVTCPNRDGTVAKGGCTFCGEKGIGYEMLNKSIAIQEQINHNIEYIGKKYNAKKYIAYFQNYTNTYCSLEDFKKYIKEALVDDIVEIAISTRPDCIFDSHMKFLKEIMEKYKIAITIELGLQTVNYQTLIKINRGHTLAEYIDAMIKIKKYGFKICTHVILNFPWDDINDVIETSKIISVLKSDYVKLHALYVVKDTVLEKQYLNKEFEMHTLDDYKEKVKAFLEYLDKDIKVQRIIGRAPYEDTIFVNWSSSWWKIRDDIEKEMLLENRYQGRLNNNLINEIFNVN